MVIPLLIKPAWRALWMSCERLQQLAEEVFEVESGVPGGGFQAPRLDPLMMADLFIAGYGVKTLFMSFCDRCLKALCGHSEISRHPNRQRLHFHESSGCGYP